MITPFMGSPQGNSSGGQNHVQGSGSLGSAAMQDGTKGSDASETGTFAQLLGEALSDGPEARPQGVRRMIMGFLGLGSGAALDAQGNAVSGGATVSDLDDGEALRASLLTMPPGPTDQGEKPLAYLPMDDGSAVSSVGHARFDGGADALANRGDPVDHASAVPVSTRRYVDSDAEGSLHGGSGPGVRLASESRSSPTGLEVGLAFDEEAALAELRHPETPAAMSAGEADRDASKLDPRLQASLERVIQRLQDEYGISAEIAEGVRSQQRQEALFAQGRTVPGQKVTWTRNSEHRHGRAVDLVLNGQWNDLGPYAVLQKVAQEEGLTTLGMQDPGHVELGDVLAEGGEDGDRPNGERDLLARRRGGVARVAQIASTARVAQVARPGTVRSVEGQARSPVESLDGMALSSETNPGAVGRESIGNPGEVHGQIVNLEVEEGARSRSGDAEGMDFTNKDGRDSESRRAQAKSRAQNQATRAEKATVGSEAVGLSAADPRKGSATESRGSEDGGDGSQVDVDAGSLGRTDPAQKMTGLSEGEGIKGPTAADRVNRIEQLKEAAGARGPRMHVELQDVDGAGTRVKVDLRGRRLGASIGVENDGLGDRLRARVGDLRSALETQGFEPDGLQIRTVGDGESSLQAAKGIAASEAAASSDQRTNDPRQREQDLDGKEQDTPTKNRDPNEEQEKRRES